MNPAPWRDPRFAKSLAGVLLAGWLGWQGLHFYFTAFYGFAWDFSINWTAAHAWRTHVPLYDAAALQALAINHIDAGMAQLFTGRFNRFIGLPSTAMLHTPFTLFPFEQAVTVYRLCSLAAWITSAWLLSLAVPANQRRKAWLAGILCLLCWQAVPFSLRLGQVDAWVVLALAGSVLAFSRQQQGLAGACLGLATLLKVSPGLLLVYCLLKRQWSVLVAAGGMILLCLGVAACSRGMADLADFYSTVVPALGEGTRHVQNQALGAFLARLATDDSRLLDFSVSPGNWNLVGPALALAASLFLAARTTSPSPLAITPLILFALLAGPITWDHYLGWALLPVMVLAARLPWRCWPLLVLLLLPLAFPVPYPTPEQVAAQGGWRWLTGLQTVSLLGIAGWMLWLNRAATNPV